MNSKSFFKTNAAKVLGLFSIFVIIVFIGSILFTCGLSFQKRTWVLRGIYMLIALLWVVLSTRAICIRTKFSTLCMGVLEDYYAHQEDFERDIRKRYQDLVEQFPLAIAEYESHCWKQDPRPSNPEMMEKALAMDSHVWMEKEMAAKQKIANKREARKKGE